jgi:hypothetical protein
VAFFEPAALFTSRTRLGVEIDLGSCALVCVANGNFYCQNTGVVVLQKLLSIGGGDQFDLSGSPLKFGLQTGLTLIHSDRHD